VLAEIRRLFLHKLSNILAANGSCTTESSAHQPDN
jgi:hypothetical protein